MTRPPEAHPLAHVLALHSTGPTDPRFSTLLVGAVLTTGRRTVANVLRTLRHLAPGHPADDRRVLSRAPWSGVAVGCAPTRFLLDRVVPDGPVTLVGDDTVGGHPGRTVYGKGRHRDAVRSSHAYTAWRYGHTWVVLAVLVDRYRTPEVRTAEGARHRTPARLVCRLLRLVLLRFPDRAVVLAGDSGFGTHEVARFGHRHRGRPTLVSKLPPDADVFAPPPAYAGHGRPRVKGARVPKPRPAAATARRARRAVTWYGGGGTRRVEAATGAGQWYQGGCGLVPVRWACVKDTTGTHRGEYRFTADLALTADAAAGTYGGRWDIETTAQEARPALGLETTRGRCKGTVLRAGPGRFGLYTVVAALFAAPPASNRTGAVAWPGKAAVTLSDAMRAVRRWSWSEAVLPPAGHARALQKRPEPVRERLLTTLAPAA